MQDTLISFETAKLANELNFNINTSFTYSPQGELFNILDLKYPIKAPTQSLLEKWLREKHNIDIEHKIINNKGIKQYGFDIIIFDKGVYIKLEYKKSFEKGLENALYEALKLVKNEKK